ncbi:MAG: hypothetical protein HYU24_09455 [Candidatus Rokubacteria bacterium]|nr:hypothetical protein [Candidatus Rokubacteria bacterium]
MRVPLLIAGAISAIDAGIVPWLRTERMFGWILVVWMPLGAVLALVQVCLRIGWAVSRITRR